MNDQPVVASERIDEPIAICRDRLLKLITRNGSAAFFACFLLLLTTAAVHADAIRITKIEPTVFFPKVSANDRLKQLAELHLDNSGDPVSGRVKVSVKGEKPYYEKLGVIQSGATVKKIHVPAVLRTSEVTFELYVQEGRRPVAVQKMTWQPQRKWRIYCMPNSHHDLGFGNYYQMMRHDVRQLGMKLALECCAKTDDWDEADKYRWTVETSEPLVGFIQDHSKATVDELARRIQEGRIELGGCHNAASTEMMSYELLARLFYTPNRYVRDLLGIEARKTCLINDVPGLTRSLPLYLKEAAIPYLYHAYNLVGVGNAVLDPAAGEPVFYWQAPDGDKENRLLVRSTRFWARHPFRRFTTQEQFEEAMTKFILDRTGRGNQPYDALLCSVMHDFSLPEMRIPTAIREWNAKWSYPKLICSTPTMFFDDVLGQAGSASIPQFAKDAPNPWTDQEISDAELAGRARRLGYALPTSEKFATIASAVADGGYPWKDLWHAFNRLLMYHEHTNGANRIAWSGYVPDGLSAKTKTAHATYYETENAMHRALAREAETFRENAMRHALDSLQRSIATTSDLTLIVFNPLGRARTDMVRVDRGSLPPRFRLLDNVTGRELVYQTESDGRIAFAARDVPPLGYKTFRVVPGEPSAPSPSRIAAGPDTLENRFYKITFDKATGSITSIRDKKLDVELVDADAPHRFNEYLYKHCESNESELTWRNAKSATLSSSAGPVLCTMIAKIAAAGCRSIEQQVILYDDIDRIDFVQKLDKAPSGRTRLEYENTKPGNKGLEAVFYAMPLAVPDFQIRHELAGTVVEPLSDQFAGSAASYYAIQHFSDISNDRYGVTLATIEAPLVEYGKPTHLLVRCSKTEKPARSHVYLHLMSNTSPIQTNLCIDQPGRKLFTWSLRSHKGDWRAGNAYEFGWDVSHPLITRVARGVREGGLPNDRHSFVGVEPSNVVCSTIKTAEANGSGFILRLNELAGKETTATVSLPFIEKITAANETSLIEDDRPVPVEVLENNRIRVAIRPHGVKTIRVCSEPRGPLAKVIGLTARTVSDEQVDLTWKPPRDGAATISHYNVYRGDSVDFEPTFRHLVGRPAKAAYSDRPELNYGGWIDNRLEPGTTYYYSVRPVDRFNNEGSPTEAIAATTLTQDRANVAPAPVEGLDVVHVSPVSTDNFLILWFYTNCESDVTHYRIHRSTAPGFVPDESNRIAVIDATKRVSYVVPKSQRKIRRPVREYNRQMYVDQTVVPDTTYYYKVYAVDDAGNASPYSREATGRTGDRQQEKKGERR